MQSRPIWSMRVVFILNEIFTSFALTHFSKMPLVKSQIETIWPVLDLFLFLLTRSSFILFWFSILSCSSSFMPDLSWKKLTIHKLSFSLSLWMLQFIPHKLRCAHGNAALLCLHSSLRNQGWHSCVNDAVQSSSSPTSLLLPSQYTNPIPRLAVWCGNSIHISCQPERFLGLTHVLHGWGEQITQHLYPLL